MTYQVLVDVAVLEAAAVPGHLAGADHPSIAGVTSGDTTCTSAPTAISCGTRRWATWPRRPPAPSGRPAGGPRVGQVVHRTIIAARSARPWRRFTHRTTLTVTRAHTDEGVPLTLDRRSP